MRRALLNAVAIQRIADTTFIFRKLGQDLGIAGSNLNAPGLPLIGITGQGNGNANLGNIDFQVQDFPQHADSSGRYRLWTHGRHPFTTGSQSTAR